MKLEARIQALGDELIRCSAEQAGEQSWLDRLIMHAIQDPQFRIQTLRFIDVLPSLDDDIELTHHLQEYFGDLQTPLPELAQWGLKKSDTPWLAHIAAPLVRMTVRGFSRKFMGGSSISNASRNIDRLLDNGMLFSLDILGEASITEKEADEYQAAYLGMIPDMSRRLNQRNVTESTGHLRKRVMSRLNVSLKLSSLYSQIDPVNFVGSINTIKRRLYPILQCARENNTVVMIDMESYDVKHITLRVFLDILKEPAFSDWSGIGLAIQTYLKDSYDDIQSIHEVLQKRNAPATIRLVRGAYWDYETVIASQNNWPSPVWTRKQDTDANFERCLDYLLSNHPVFKTAVATHNLRSIAAAIALAEKYGLSSDEYEFQMLYGMADSLKQVLVDKDQQLRIYVPYGETLPGMAYLVRRLLENSSGESILDIGLNDSQPVDLIKPEFSSGKSIPDVPVDRINRAGHFSNQALLRFTDTAERDAFQRAITRCQSRLGREYPLIINGKTYKSDAYIQSINPAKPDEVIGTVSAADQQLADRALKSATEAHASWSRLSLSDRAAYLYRIASALKQRRNEFSAWQVLEAGKNWREADADVCEAIDFLNYYAEQAENMEHPEVNQASGELNIARYHSRGVGLVIPPWNFPLAILVGMLSATIVSGNCAILKPSSQTPVIAARFVELMHQAGLPDGVVNLLTGSGSEIGEYLAKHAGVHIIAFTGSMEVGTHLVNIAAQLNAGQTHLKHIIAEMGGKNAIIIDNDADLDDAVAGTVRSAFGYQGQKCSAASRVIVLDNIYPAFIDRMIEATRSIKCGPPVHAENAMGPVISQQAYNGILKAIDIGKSEATLLPGDAGGVSSDYPDGARCC